MNSPVTIYAAPDVQPEAAQVLASLPLSYAPGRSAEDGVAVIDGSAGWPLVATEALDSGAVAVIVVHPQPAEVDGLRARKSLVALDSRWATNPTVAAAAAAFTKAELRAARLECRVHRLVGSSQRTALLEQLTLIRALLGPVREVRILTRSRHGYAAVGLVAGHPVDLSLVCTDAVAQSAWVRLLTSDGSVELAIPDGLNAQPGRLTVTGPDGACLSPTLYESGHRATWRRVRALLATQSKATDLDDFASDKEMALTAHQLAEG